MKSLRIGCQLYLYTITMSTYKQQTCHLYATPLNKKILTRDISTIKRTGIPSRVVLTQFSFLFLLVSIKSVKYNFFFSLLININLILNIQSINQPSLGFTHFSKVIYSVFSIHFFKRDYKSELQWSSLF